MIEKIKKIAAKKGKTFEQVAAQDFGISRYQLRRIALGQSPGSVRFWREMIKWSSGRITPDARFMDEIDADRKGEA